jgi:hypothetical protein
MYHTVIRRAPFQATEAFCRCPKASVADPTPFLLTLARDHPKAFLTGHSYHPDTGNIGGCR